MTRHAETRAHDLTRRRLLALAGAGLAPPLLSCGLAGPSSSAAAAQERDLRIRRMRVTPIALPDPPILAASGCHGPYFLRTIIELETNDGITGVGESYGSSRAVEELERARASVEGTSALRYRGLAAPLAELHPAVYAAVEMACLDAIGKATGHRACELLGGPVRDEVEFAAYLFYRYAADHSRVLDDPRLVDARGAGERALDAWGEVRSAESMADMAARFRERWGFRVLKLKAGVLEPAVELATLRAMHERFGDDAPLRIDPNGRWTVKTATRRGNEMKNLPLEYYEDPVAGQEAMARVRAATGLPLATNSCVTRWDHIRSAVGVEPIDVLLADIYWFGGITGVQALGKAAKSVGWSLGCHSNNHAGITMAAMIHAGASTPELTHALDTHYVWLVNGGDVIEGGNLPIRNGKMGIPDGPGLGVRIDRDKLARAHETYLKSGMRNRDDATTMQRFEPGWKRTLF